MLILLALACAIAPPPDCEPVADCGSVSLELCSDDVDAWVQLEERRWYCDSFTCEPQMSQAEDACEERL